MTEIAIRSFLDPSRVLIYRDWNPSAPSVFGPRAANHMLVGEDCAECAGLSLAPAIKVPGPSFWRRRAIQAVAHVLVNLINPWSGASMLNEHLEQNGSGKIGRFGRRENRFFIDGKRIELLDDGHVVTLQIHKTAIQTRRDAESGAV